MVAKRAGLTRSNRDLGKLHAVLDKAFPDLRNGDGGFDVRGLAERIGVTHTALYNAFKVESLSAKTGRKILDASGGRLTKRKLAAFLPIV